MSLPFKSLLKQGQEPRKINSVPPNTGPYDGDSENAVEKIPRQHVGADYTQDFSSEVNEQTGHKSGSVERTGEIGLCLTL